MLVENEKKKKRKRKRNEERTKRLRTEKKGRRTRCDKLKKLKIHLPYATAVPAQRPHNTNLLSL